MSDEQVVDYPWREGERLEIAISGIDANGFRMSRTTHELHIGENELANASYQFLLDKLQEIFDDFGKAKAAGQAPDLGRWNLASQSAPTR